MVPRRLPRSQLSLCSSVDQYAPYRQDNALKLQSVSVETFPFNAVEWKVNMRDGSRSWECLYCRVREFSVVLSESLCCHVSVLLSREDPCPLLWQSPVVLCEPCAVPWEWVPLLSYEFLCSPVRVTVLSRVSSVTPLLPLRFSVVTCESCCCCETLSTSKRRELFCAWAPSHEE
jgi:hypothetical protein